VLLQPDFLSETKLQLVIYQGRHRIFNKGHSGKASLAQYFLNFFIPTPPFHSRHVVFAPHD